MGRFINTNYLHIVVEKRKNEYGRLAWLVNNIVEEMVAELPPADVKLVTHSHWVHHKGTYHDYVCCAKCGELAKCVEVADGKYWHYSNYCSTCGSLMDGENEEVED